MILVNRHPGRGVLVRGTDLGIVDDIPECSVLLSLTLASEAGDKCPTSLQLVGP